MKLKLTVDGKVYEVDVEVTEPDPPRPSYVPPTIGQPRATTVSSTVAAPTRSATDRVTDKAADESKVCRSPISGVVVRVSAQVGQAIQSNDVLLVLEAMKMETVITAPVAGKIARVNATVGEPVQRGEVLVELE